MSSRKSPVRASFLVLVVVASVALGGVAGADDGTTTTASVGSGTTTASVEDAVEYGGTIELALDSGTDSAVEAGNVDVWVDGAERSVSVAVDGTDGRVVLTGLEDVHEHQSLTVRVDQSGTLETGNVSVTVTGPVLRANDELGTYPGAEVAYVASGTDATLSLSRDGSFIAQRSTGTNSRLFVVDTGGQERGPIYHVNESSGASSSYTLRDLGLTAEASATDLSEGEAVTVAVTSNGADRPIAVRLVGTDSGEVVRETIDEIDGNGEASVTLSDLPSGSFEVVVEDVDTGITATTAEIAVGGGTESTVEFARKILADQRGDVVAVPIRFVGDAAGGSANLTLGNEDVGFKVATTVTDDDGDGRATIRWNTARSDGPDGGLAVEGGSLDDVSVDVPVDDPVLTGEYPISVAADGTETDVGIVVVEERSTEGVSVASAPGAVGESAVPDVVRTAPVDDTLALDELTLEHDWLVVRIRASGLEGYVEAVGDVDGANGLTLAIEQTEPTTDENEAPVTVDVSDGRLVADGRNDTYYVALDSKFALRDAEPGDAFEVTFAVDGNGNEVTDGSETVSTTFTAVNGTASFDVDGGALTVENAPDATVGGTSAFAAGTELEVTLRSEGGQSPFVERETATVAANGTWEATFDLSDRPDDGTFTAVVSKGGEDRSRVAGEIGTPATETAGDGTETVTGDGTDTPAETADGGATDTATPTGTDAGTPTDADGSTETPTPAGDDETTPTLADEGPNTPTPTTTPSPGFGVVVALAALAGVVVALRRRR